MANTPYTGAKARVAHLTATPLASLAALTLAVACLGAAPAKAQDATAAGSYNTPYGYSYGGESRNFRAGTRDAFNNRAVVNGRILLGEEVSNLPRTLSGVISPSFGGASSAVGNQLNVIVEGDWNTVVIDSTQTNNGDVIAGAALNGELALND